MDDTAQSLAILILHSLSAGCHGYLSICPPIWRGWSLGRHPGGEVVGGWVGWGGGKNEEDRQRGRERRKGEKTVSNIQKGRKSPPPRVWNLLPPTSDWFDQNSPPHPAPQIPPPSFSRHVPNTLRESHLPVIRPEPLPALFVVFRFRLLIFEDTAPLPPRKITKNTHTHPSPPWPL